MAAVRFLTRIPIRTGSATIASGEETSIHTESVEPRTGAAAFGLVGLALGIVAAVPVLIVGAAHPVPAALAALAVLAVLSGGLHLDGLADTADALAAPAGAAERARTDPRAGSAGVVALVLVLGLDAALLAELAGRGSMPAAAALIAAAAVSRASAPVWAVTVGRRLAPPGSGLGRWFADATDGVDAIVAAGSVVAATLVLVAIAGTWVAPAVALGCVLAAAAGAAVIRARGRLDGDGYGALIEIAFSAVLVSAVLVQ